MVGTFFEIILHFDKYLNIFVQSYGLWTYLVLFLIIFCETGLVVTPFLPGDSLLFTVGAFSAAGSFDLALILILLSIAGITGDSVNYAAGKYISDELFQKTLGRFVKKEHLHKTHAFYEKYGAKTIVLARFVPIIRTFAPFVAGIGKMSYMKFAAYNVLAACFGFLHWSLPVTFSGTFL